MLASGKRESDPSDAQAPPPVVEALPYMPPPEPADEAARLQALRQLQVLDTPAEERFDRITKMARRLFDTPIALVGLVDASRLWFKSVQGLPIRETPRAVSFCGHAILESSTLVVEDALLDERFANNPLVLDDPNIRFYAGEPLIDPEGHCLGTLCIIDRKPRNLSKEERGTLSDLAAMAIEELMVVQLSEAQQEFIEELSEARRQERVDGSTLCWDRQASFELLLREREKARRARVPLAVMMVEVKNSVAVTDDRAHPPRDLVLKDVAARLRAGTRPYDTVGRYGREKFMVICSGADSGVAQRVAERLCEQVAQSPIDVAGTPLEVTVSIGVASMVDQAPGAAELVAAADKALDAAKLAGQSRVCTAADSVPSVVC